MLGDTIGPLSGSSRCSISDPCGRSHPRRRDDDQGHLAAGPQARHDPRAVREALARDPRTTGAEGVGDPALRAVAHRRRAPAPGHFADRYRDRRHRRALVRRPRHDDARARLTRDEGAARRWRAVHRTDPELHRGGEDDHLRWRFGMTKYLILIIGAVLVAASGSNAQMGSPLNNPDMACTIEGRCANATSKCVINGVNKTGRDCLRCLPGDRVVETLPPTGVGGTAGAVLHKWECVTPTAAGSRPPATAPKRQN